MRLATLTVVLATFYFGFVVKCETTTNSEDVLNKLIAGLIKHIVESSNANKVPNQEPISTTTIAPETKKDVSDFMDLKINDDDYYYESNDPLDNVIDKYISNDDTKEVEEDYYYDPDDIDKAEEKKLADMFKENKKSKNDDNDYDYDDYDYSDLAYNYDNGNGNEDGEYNVQDYEYEGMEINNATGESIKKVLKYNSENPDHPGYSIRIVKNNVAVDEKEKSTYRRRQMAFKRERKRLKQKIDSFWSWQDKYSKRVQVCDYAQACHIAGKMYLKQDGLWQTHYLDGRNMQVSVRHFLQSNFSAAFPDTFANATLETFDHDVNDEKYEINFSLYFNDDLEFNRNITTEDLEKVFNKSMIDQKGHIGPYQVTQSKCIFAIKVPRLSQNFVKVNTSANKSLDENEYFMGPPRSEDLQTAFFICCFVLAFGMILSIPLFWGLKDHLAKYSEHLLQERYEAVQKGKDLITDELIMQKSEQVQFYEAKEARNSTQNRGLLTVDANRDIFKRIKQEATYAKEEQLKRKYKNARLKNHFLRLQTISEAVRSENENIDSENTNANPFQRSTLRKSMGLPLKKIRSSIRKSIQYRSLRKKATTGFQTSTLKFVKSTETISSIQTLNTSHSSGL